MEFSVEKYVNEEVEGGVETEEEKANGAGWFIPDMAQNVHAVIIL